MDGEDMVHLIINPNGSKGSIKHRSREGLGMKLTSRGAYARNIPSGLRILAFNILSMQLANKLAPAESPANTIRLPEEVYD
ncbi:unnamed protein product [Leptidea sinapis]|uniref:Uncharacterized protein n=1 Tax=Leptidea sinapis TaxID=189913 RepID=A0A5E4Q2W3_9NEOP|nr:unnamed protein product [Leptidea sinapis]